MSMSSISWSHYQIPLSRQLAGIPARLSGRSAATQLAGRGDRFVAVAVDVFTYVLAVAVGIFVTQGFTEGSVDAARRLGPWLLGALVFGICQLTLLSMRGQTVGKLVMGVRIVNYEDDGNPGFLRAVVLRSLVPAVIMAIPLFGKFFAVVDLLSIAGQERRCWHDMIAGTKVVES